MKPQMTGGPDGRRRRRDTVVEGVQLRFNSGDLCVNFGDDVVLFRVDGILRCVQAGYDPVALIFEEPNLRIELIDVTLVDKESGI